LSQNIREKVEKLPCWNGPVCIEALSGGMTNLNFKVTDGDDRYVVRLGEDNPYHLILRANEIASSRAAHSIGVSPEPIYTEPGVLVIRYISGKVFEQQDIRDADNLRRIIDLLKRFHSEMPNRFNGYSILFWVFQVVRHYGNILQKGPGHYGKILPDLMATASRLEAKVGAVNIVFGHNDLLAANFIDDGERLWLIDFDYAGFNSPLFDLSNLASNNALGVEQEKWLLNQYFGHSPDEGEWRAYNAMKCASLLRETMWSMVSEWHSDIDFDYADYTRQNMERFERAMESFNQEFGSR